MSAEASAEDTSDAKLDKGQQGDASSIVVSDSEADDISEYPMKGIREPGSHDVLLGRGGGANNHSGNVLFRELVKEHKLRYMKMKKIDKPKVAVEVVAMWRKLKPPGRFLERCVETKSFYDVGDKKAQLKASQCLREKTPEVMTFCKELEEKRLEDAPDVLAPLLPHSAPSFDSWGTDEQRYLRMQYRSLMNAKTFRLVPLYFFSGQTRRCIQRVTASVEYLAVVVEGESTKESTAASSTPTNSRYGWVRSIPNGRIELSCLTHEEKVMLDKIRYQVEAVDPSVGLPALDLGSE